MLATEVLLMALVTGLYLYDSALLLFSNEAVLSPTRWRSRWVSGFGSIGVTLRGKGLLLPNPLLPTRPMFRLAWKLEGSTPHPPGDWAESRKQLRTYSPFVWSLAAVMFVLLPVSLTGQFGDGLLLLAFALIYFNVLCTLLLLWFDRKTWSFTGKGFAAMAFDLLLCPPFALNLVRRLSLRVPVREDFVVAARRLQSPSDWQATRAALAARLEEELLGEEENSTRHAALLRRLEEFKTEEEKGELP